MTDKEKLVDLLFEIPMFPASMDYNRMVETIVLAAEWLADKGVTFATDKNDSSKWIPVSERLPDIDGKYLVARRECGRYSISVRKFRKEVPCWHKGYCGHWERRTNGITHWLPLPEPPKEGE